MKESFIELLCCIKCRGELFVSRDYTCQINNEDIEFGVLCCKNCSALYPVINGVGVFFRENLLCHYLNKNEKDLLRQLGFNYNNYSLLNEIEKRQLKVAENWSYEYGQAYNYSKRDLEKKGYLSEECFFNFIPIEASDLKDKNVVIWCSGKGKEAYHISKYSPKLIVINEIGDEIYSIGDLIPDFSNILLLRCDMLNNPLKAGFADYSICDHALQHVVDYRLGFVKMLEVLKIGGTVGFNVYSYENNFLITHIIEPLKFIFHRFPLKMQEYVAFVPAIFIYLLIHLVYVPIKKIISYNIYRRFPLFDHMIFWSKDSLKFIWIACFDLIHAPISYHFKKQEIIDMAISNKVKVAKLINTHGTTWSFIGKKVD